MITNYKGMIECINDDFEFLCDTKYLELIKISPTSKWLNTNGDGDVVIYHTKYKFIFNHESPGHANLFVHQKWPKGVNHYIMNDYEELINRYTRRIQNMKDLLNSKNEITFILTRPQTQLGDVGKLNEVIKNKYPSLHFNFVFLDFDKYAFYDHLRLMKIDDEEVKRLNV